MATELLRLPKKDDSTDSGLGITRALTPGVARRRSAVAAVAPGTVEG